jgi:hypothetical protein
VLLTLQQESDYIYLLGLYLGDGCISLVKTQKNGQKVYRLRLFQNADYVNLIQKHIQSIKSLFPHNKIGVNKKKKSNCCVISLYHTRLLNYFPQHGPGKKHNRAIELEEWQKDLVLRHPKSFLTGLYESDGTRYKVNIKGYTYEYIDFTNMSTDIHRLYKWACSLIGVETKMYSNGKNQGPRKQSHVKLLTEFMLKKD